ncbi:MAG TPA: kelch repeat-containing protein [Candidatus Bathyarchaeia archaeon]|nr:kelch repeat-containing protein [Candidatus Bathyarchaeia archaeon]
MRLALIALLLIGCTYDDPGPRRTVTLAPGETAAPPLTVAPSAWKRIADITTPRSEVAAAVFRGVVYVVGGFGGGNVVETYVPDHWSAAPRYPIFVDHAMAAGVDTAGTPGLYVFGGNVSGVAVARSFRYFGDEGWREIAPMPAPRSQAAAAAIGGRIFIVGGAQGDRLFSPTFVYDTATDRWTTAAPIPTPRDHLAAAAIDGRVCAVGGRRLSLLQNLATFECYDPATDAWQAMADAPTARGGIGAAALGSRLFVTGGEQPVGTFKDVDIFDAASAKWARGPDLPTSRHGLAVVALAGTLYVMSGGPAPGVSQTAVCEALDVR